MRAGSDEQPGSNPVPWPARAWRREEVAASDRGDVVGHFLFLQTSLDGRELTLNVLVEGDEHESLIEVSRLVQAAVEVVAAA